MTDLKEEFWGRMAGVRSAMLGIKGQGRLVAMSPRVDKDLPGDVWFITANGTELGKSVQSGPQTAQLVIVDDGAGLYADLEGTLTHCTDQKALDEVWNSSAEAWFDDGKTDPQVCLMRFSPAMGEISVTPASGVKYLYEMAKARITGTTPDVGDQGDVVF